jgi:hypothetical protein
LISIGKVVTGVTVTVDVILLGILSKKLYENAYNDLLQLPIRVYSYNIGINNSFASNNRVPQEERGWPIKLASS